MIDWTTFGNLQNRELLLLPPRASAIACYCESQGLSSPISRMLRSLCFMLLARVMLILIYGKNVEELNYPQAE